MNAQRCQEWEWKELLKDTRDCHEFEVYLQPKYELKEMKIVAAEALIRWISEKRGILYPNDFIPFFEKSGFIINSDFYVLEQVCRKIRCWLDQGVEPVPLSVNQSRVHLSDPYYIDRLSFLMERYRIPKHSIELELTERLFTGSMPHLLQVMEDLHGLGFLLSMDDFGAGYSSLHLLSQIPVDILKLDKAFLHDARDERRSRIIIANLVGMAHQLGIKVVCEGVESEQQVAFLRGVDCDMAQGFFYAKPMPMRNFDAFRRGCDAF